MKSPGTPPVRERSLSPPRQGSSLPGITPASLDIAAPPTVPDYDLLRRIGHGAYGDVWLARSKATGVLRAAKIVWRRSFEDERPFRREFEGIQHFERISREHPSQLALFHIGRNEAEGNFYYVMELADGLGGRQKAEGRVQNEKTPSGVFSAFSILPSSLEPYSPHTLRADLEHGRLPAARVLEIGLALAEALSHLHANGLVHRDVKPSNVIFVNGRPKLADIGLVTDASDQCSIVGTEGYLPPEGPGTPQADIFALGKVLYEAATGLDRRDFPKLPDDLRTYPDAAQVFELNEINLRACATDPHQRYVAVDTMLAELALLQGGKSVRRKRSRQQLWLICRRAGIAFAAFATVVFGVAILMRENAQTDVYPDGPPSANMVANMLCAKGMLIVQEDNHAQFAEAYTNFNQAIALDTNFARPYIGLLDLRLRHEVPGVENMTPADLHKIAERLKALAPHLGATALAESVISFNDWDFPAARNYAQQAIMASPKYELGHIWYGYMLMEWGWPIEARAQADISQTLAPSKATSYRLHGHTYYLQRDFTNAITWYRQAIALDQHEPAYGFIGCAFRAMGDYTNAIATFEKSDLLDSNNEFETRKNYDRLRQAFKVGGARGYWQEEWSFTGANTNEGFYWKACVQAHLGNTNSALNWLDKSFATHERNGLQSVLNDLLFDECWDGLHDNPRFKDLLDKIGFTKVMPPKR